MLAGIVDCLETVSQRAAVRQGGPRLGMLHHPVAAAAPTAPSMSFSFTAAAAAAAAAATTMPAAAAPPTHSLTHPPVLPTASADEDVSMT